MITVIYSLTNGEVIKNEKAMPKGMPASINPMNMGIDEHEQKGVIAPNIEANTLPIPALFPVKCFLMVFVEI